MARKAYTASEPVYVDKRLYRRDEVFVTDKPKGSKWTPVTKAEKAAIDASQPHGQMSVDESMPKASLIAIAAERGIETKGLSVKQLVAAIKAADEPAL
jgi:hypothetical protein